MSNSAYSLFPIKYPTLYEYYEKQRDAFWVPAEVDLADDIKDWRDKLNDQQKTFITYILAFFAQADGIVLENIEENFSLDIDIAEFKIFYGIQSGIEAIHWEMYSILIDTLINDSELKSKAFQAIQHYPSIKKKADWMKKWMTNDEPYLHRLIAFACAEGIYFSSSFAGIFYFKKKGLLSGLVLSNKFIARDEGLHRDFALEAVNVLKKEGRILEDDVVYTIVKEAVDIEMEFVKESLQVELIGMNSEQMCQYVKYVADHLLSTIHLKKLYNVSNPFDWMNMISMTNKQNFFEGRVSEYKKNNKQLEFNFDSDF